MAKTLNIGNSTDNVNTIFNGKVHITDWTDVSLTNIEIIIN